MKSKSPNILLLLGMVSLSVWEADLYLPSFISIQRHFNVSESLVQLSLNLYFLVFALGVLIIGPISDRYGRKNTFLSCLFIDCLGTCIVLFSPTMSIFLLGKSIQAIGGSAGAVLTRLLVQELFGESKVRSMMGLLFAAVSFSLAFTPIIGGIFESQFGWKSHFVVLLSFQAILWVGVYFYLPQKMDVLSKRPSIQLILNSLNRSFFYYTTIAALFWSILYLYVGASAFYLIQKFQVAPAIFGALFAALILGMTLGNLSFSRLTTYCNGTRIYRICAGLIICSGGLLLYKSESLAIFCVAIFFYLLAIGILFPMCQENAIQTSQLLRSSHFSIYIFLQTLSSSVIGALFSLNSSPSAMPYTVAILGILGSLFLLFLREKQEQTSILR